LLKQQSLYQILDRSGSCPSSFHQIGRLGSTGQLVTPGSFMFDLRGRIFGVCTGLGHQMCRPIRHFCWRAYASFIECLSPLIRGSAKFCITMQASYAHWASILRGGWDLWPPIRLGMFLAAFGLGWCGGNIWFLDVKRENRAGGPAIKQVIGIEDHVAIDAVVNRITGIESNGDPNATNKHSSALGLGQFLDQTWFDLIRTHRPDLARGHSKDETLESKWGTEEPPAVDVLTRRGSIYRCLSNTGIVRADGLVGRWDVVRGDRAEILRIVVRTFRMSTLHEISDAQTSLEPILLVQLSENEGLIQLSW
jgi:hypothetical protein